MRCQLPCSGEMRSSSPVVLFIRLVKNPVKWSVPSQYEYPSPSVRPLGAITCTVGEGCG
jgi:hypothetical protein